MYAADQPIGLQAFQPAREEHERERVCCSDPDRRRLRSCDLTHMRPRVTYPTDQHRSQRLKLPPRHRQTYRVGRTIEQCDAGPFFQRANTSAESRLCEVPRFGGTREISGAAELKIFLQPDQLHCSFPDPCHLRLGQYEIGIGLASGSGATSPPEIGGPLPCVSSKSANGLTLSPRPSPMPTSISAR